MAAMLNKSVENIGAGDAPRSWNGLYGTLRLEAAEVEKGTVLRSTKESGDGTAEQVPKMDLQRRVHLVSRFGGHGCTHFYCITLHYD
jgi:hypothetical protein